MKPRLLSKIAALLVLAACGKEGAAPGPSASATSASSASSSSSSRARPPASSASASTVASGFHLELGTPGTVILKNDTNEAVRVEWEIPIERSDGGAWTAVHAMNLQQKCFESAPADKCVSVPAHSSFTPRPWTGWFGCTQCGTCRANAPAGAGSYRFVAIECDAKTRHESPPLEVADEGRFAHTAHVYSPKTEPNAIVIDNESDDPVSFQSDVEASKLDKHNAFGPIPNAGMSLAQTCSEAPPSCVTVAPHASLHTIPFRPGCKRCDDKCAASRMTPGEFEMRVTVCNTQKPLYNDVYGASFDTTPFVVGANGAVSTR